MNKVVINDCYGGFGLSDEAIEYCRQNGLEEYWEPNPDYNPNEREDKWDNPKGWFAYYDIPRHHPTLVKCVEELGDNADGQCAKLVVVEIPGNQYNINEYDGWESVETPEDEQYWITIK